MSFRNLGLLMTRRCRVQSSPSFPPSLTLVRNLSASMGFTPTLPPSLSDIIKTDMFEDLTTSEISRIWISHHADKPQSLGLCLYTEGGGVPNPKDGVTSPQDGDGDKNGDGYVPPALSSASIHSNASLSPFFIHPVFRAGGVGVGVGGGARGSGTYFVLLLQYMPSGNTFVLTDLESYKSDPLTAQPLASFKMYGDFEVSKGVVLVRGDVVGTGEGGYVTKNEAVGAVRKVLGMYAEGYVEGPEAFNFRSGEFDFEKYIEGCRADWEEREGREGEGEEGQEGEGQEGEGKTEK